MKECPLSNWGIIIVIIVISLKNYYSKKEPFLYIIWLTLFPHQGCAKVLCEGWEMVKIQRISRVKGSSGQKTSQIGEQLDHIMLFG